MDIIHNDEYSNSDSDSVSVSETELLEDLYLADTPAFSPFNNELTFHVVIDENGIREEMIDRWDSPTPIKNVIKKKPTVSGMGRRKTNRAQNGTLIMLSVLLIPNYLIEYIKNIGIKNIYANLSCPS